MRAIVARLMTGWRGLLVSALVGFAVAGSLAWEARGWQAASLVASARTAQARAEKELSDLRATVATNIADLERLRADDQMRALNVAKAQTAKLLDLQARLAESERERVRMSAKLREELAHATVSDARDLGPVVLRYLERVRAEQSAP
jgi:hypothetical protein